MVRWMPTTASAPPQSLTDDDLQPILAASRSSRFGVWDIGLRMLGRLGGRHTRALAAMEGLFDSGTAMLRCRVVTSLRDCLPREFCVHMARRGLADRAKSVRVGAGQTCQRLLLKELLTEMSRVEQNEKCPKARLDMRCSIGLLRDGFFLWPPDEDGSRTLEVRISEGVPEEITYLDPPGTRSRYPRRRKHAGMRRSFGALKGERSGRFAGTRKAEPTAEAVSRHAEPVAAADGGGI